MKRSMDDLFNLLFRYLCTSLHASSLNKLCIFRGLKLMLTAGLSFTLLLINLEHLENKLIDLIKPWGFRATPRDYTVG